MFRSLVSFWRIWLIICSLVVVGIVVAGTVRSAYAASGSSFIGNEVFISNNGSKANISTVNPNIYGNASFEFVMSYTQAASQQRAMQTGWTKQPACGGGSQPYVFPEWFDWRTGSIVYHNSCSYSLGYSGTHSYFNEYNPNTGYWCNGFDSATCLQGGVYKDDILMTNANYVTAYGETSDTAAQLGGTTSNHAVLSQVSYKIGNGTITSPVSSTGNAYGTCLISPCPYSKNAFISSGFLRVENWTN